MTPVTSAPSEMGVAAAAASRTRKRYEGVASPRASIVIVYSPAAAGNGLARPPKLKLVSRAENGSALTIVPKGVRSV